MSEVRVSLSGVTRALREAGATGSAADAKVLARDLIEGHATRLTELAVKLANERGSKTVHLEDVRLANIQIHREGMVSR